MIGLVEIGICDIDAQPKKIVIMASVTEIDDGLYCDEMNKLRVVDPEISQQAIELREGCKEFTEKLQQFRTVSEGLIEVADQLAALVEKEKIKTIGHRNLLQSITKIKQAERQQLEALLVEKQMQLNRLRVQYESLQCVEAEQKEMIEQFLMQK